MRGHRAGEGRTFVAAFFAAAAFVLPAAAAEGVAACPEAGNSLFSAEAAGARDGTTVRLRDGSEVRLAGIVAASELDGDMDAVRGATTALDALVAGHRISLHGNSRTTDRYGRIVAHVTVGVDPPLWVQAALVEVGAARVAPGSGAPDCAKALLAHESKARWIRRGIWGDAGFTVQTADDVPTLLAASGRYAVVEGRVRHIGEAGGRLFLDFGRRYSQDFTVVVPREAQAAFATSGMDLRGLSGKRVRARGILFTWGGPALELRLPAALELIGAGGI